MQQSRFLDLPGELRNAIYELAVVDHSGGIEIEKTLKEPALLSVCTQIRYEATAVYYEQNKFRYDAIHLDLYSVENWVTDSAAATLPDLARPLLLSPNERRHHPLDLVDNVVCPLCVQH